MWFHELRLRDWFVPDSRVDSLLRGRFARELTALARRRPGEFLDDPETALAAVLLFDQLPRNLFRQSPRAYAFDPLARAIAKAALGRRWDRALNARQCQFLAMPLMHSEAIADQRRSVAIFTRLGPRYGHPFAVAHYRMIARFGRFPHRNAVLGRASTQAETRAVEQGFAW